MVKKRASMGWLDAVAKSAKVAPEAVDAVLTKHLIRPTPVVATPRRIVLRSIEFSGKKMEVDDAGPFSFEWQRLNTGIWAMLTEANLKGKSTIIEVVRWLLRGRRAETLQDDVWKWINKASLSFDLDCILHRVVVEKSQDVVAGNFVKSSAGKDIEIASFESAGEFEAVMSSFFMKELSLHSITEWRGGASEDEGKTVVHEWPSFSGVMFIGSDYNSLLGDVVTAGLPVRLMQMYLGLPWVSTLSAAKALQKGLKQDHDTLTRRREQEVKERKVRVEEITKKLNDARKKLEVTPSDLELRQNISIANRRFAAAEQKTRQLMQSRESAEKLHDDANKIFMEDRKELQTFLDEVQAGAVFRKLDPSFCPRCDNVITAARKKRELETHTCSVCGESVASTEDVEERRKVLEDRVSASKAALKKAKENIEDLSSNLNLSLADAKRLEKICEDLEGKLKNQFGQRRELEHEVTGLEARLEEASTVTVPESKELVDDIVISAIVKETERIVKDAQSRILDDVSDAITGYAKRFGMHNLSKATLKGNATLPLVKGGENTTYSKVTKGEQLRLKVATVLAMLKVADKHGVGRHPGLLMIDSPGAQEIASEDLNALVSGLVEISTELPHLQVFVAGLATPAIAARVSNDRMRYAAGDGSLW